MKALKKFLFAIFAITPFSAGAIGPLAIAGIVAGVGIIGASIWRSVSPVNMESALDFFTSCWTCQIFSDVMLELSNLLPGIYSAIGRVVIPMSVTLLAIFIAWNLFKGYLNGKQDDASKMVGNFGTYVVKLTLLIGLLLMPLPRFITSVFIEPAFTIGTSLDYVVSDNNKFAECMVATALADPVSVSADASNYGAFSPKLRHQLACEIANVHQITGLGMTVGWTMLSMAFNSDYMHKILNIPVFPNVPIFFAGLLILVLYFIALLPIPLYFLEVFIKLSMDLIMLPLMLMAWMFDEENFAVFPKGGRTIRQMLDDVIKAIVGIALTVVFLTFSIMFLNAVFGSWSGANVLQTAIANNDSKILMDGLVFSNDSLITVILMGIFIAMFMTMIPQLTSMFFKIQISDKYYQVAKKDLNILWDGFNRVVLGKKTKPSGGGDSSGGSSGGGLSGDSGSGGSQNYTRIEYIESTGVQYIDTGIKPDNNTKIVFNAKMKTGVGEFLFGVNDRTNSFSAEIFHGSVPSRVYVEYGSFNDSIDVGHSLANELISIDMNKSISVVFDASGTIIGSVPHPASTFNISYNVYLFAFNDNYVARAHSMCMLYRCQIFDNGTLVRDFIPVLDTSGTACLYDTIENRFYYNQGIGRFTPGPTI